MSELQQILFRSFDVIPIPILISEAVCGDTLGTIPTTLSNIPIRHHRFVNQAFSAQLGYTLAELPDMTAWFATVYHDEQTRTQAIQDWNQVVMTCLANGSAVAEMSTRIYCKNGQHR